MPRIPAIRYICNRSRRMYFEGVWIRVRSTISYQNHTAMAHQNLPPNVRFIRAIEGIEEYRLDNGLQILLFPDPSRPTITVNITYRVGSRHEGYGEYGMAHIVEHLMFKGTPSHPDIPEEFTQRGVRANGTTWMDRTNYYETFPASDELLDWAIELEADRMRNANISAKDLASEAKVIANEYEMGENQPAHVLYKRMIGAAYDWHNYGHSTIGCLSDILHVPAERLREFYDRYYQPDNAVLIVTGKIEVLDALQRIQKYFGRIPAPDRSRLPLLPTYTREPAQDGERTVHLKRVGEIQLFACLYHIPASTHPHYYPLMVLNDLLTDEPTGILYKALIETGKATGVWGFIPPTAEPGYFYIHTETRTNSSLNELRQTTLDIMDRLADLIPPDKEVERSKNRLLKEWDMAFNDPEKMGILLTNFIARGDWRLFFYARDQIQAVQREDIVEVAKRYFHPSNRTTGIFEPVKEPHIVEIEEAPPLEELLRDYRGGKSRASGEAFEATPANIDRLTQKIVHANGPQIALLPKKTRGQTVHLSLTMRYGTLQSLKGKTEAALFLGRLLLKGTRQKSQEEINDILDTTRTTIDIHPYFDAVSVIIETRRAHLRTIIELLSELLFDPALEEKAFEKLRREVLAALEHRRTDPLTLASIAYRRALYRYAPEDPRYVRTLDEEIQQISNLQLDEIRQFHRQFYGTDHITIGVVGDFAPEEVRSWLQEQFSNQPAEQPFQLIPNLYFPTSAQEIEINTPDKANAVFKAGMLIPLSQRDQDYLPTVIANVIIGGGFLSSRLATRVRQKEGMSYGVASSFSANYFSASAAFSCYAIFSPSDRERLHRAVFEELDKALQEGFEERELQNAVQGWIQKYHLRFSDDRWLAATLEDNLFKERTMQWYEDLFQRARQLSTDEVHRVFRRYVQPSQFVVVKAGDFAKTTAPPTAAAKS